MSLLIKQKVFSWTERFTVTDSNGNDRYAVEGELFSWGKKLHLFDQTGRERALIRQRLWSWLPRYELLIDGQQVAEIVKEWTFFRPRYTVNGAGWTVDGDFFAHDYTVYRNGTPIATVQKEWLTWGDTYVLDVLSVQDELMALTVVLTIDCVISVSNS